MMTNTITVRDAHITFRNFSGEERKFNEAGKRNFNLVLTEAQAERFRDMGFHIRTRPSRYEDGDPDYLLKVNVNFNGRRGPKIVRITSKGQTVLTEEHVGDLDYEDFAKVDLTINPYDCSRKGGTGVSAYLNSMYVTIEEDELDMIYSSAIDSDEDGEDMPF